MIKNKKINKALSLLLAFTLSIGSVISVNATELGSIKDKFQTSSNGISNLKVELYETNESGISTNKIKETITADDGSFSFTELTPGVYNVKFNSNQYVIENAEDKAEYEKYGGIAAYVGTSETKLIKAPYLKEVFGSLEVTKYLTNTSAIVSGAEYSLYKKGESKAIATKTTDLNGKITFENLQFGDYVLKETKSPEGYVLDKNEYEITINSQDKVIKNVYDSKETSVVLTKTDKETSSAMSGVKFDLYKKLTEDQKIGTYATDSNGKIQIDQLTDGTYYFIEIETLDGYVLDSSKHEFEINSLNGDTNITINITNEKKKEEEKKYEINILKQDLETKENISGAKLQLLNEKNSVIAEWISTDKAYTIKDIDAGKYILKELEAPDGYAKAKDLEFEVTNDSKDVSITMYDKKIEIIIDKKDADTQEYVEGAKFELLDETGNVVEEWISTKEGRSIKGLSIGEYTIVEKDAPVGYEKTDDQKIKVEDTEDVQVYTVYNKQKTYEIEIYKKDKTTKENLKGATLSLLDKNENKVDTWVSTTEAHKISNLKPGTYTLVEEKAPNGYVESDPTVIELKSDMTSKTIYSLFNDYTKIAIYKKDLLEDSILSGAKLELRNENGDLIDEWISDSAPHMIYRLPEGKYILKETKAPEGYSTSEDIEFIVTKETEIQEISMYDSLTAIEIIKKDYETDEILSGAEFELLDSNNNIIDTWTSTKEGHVIKGITIGKYKIVETKAPIGYDLADPVEIEIKDTSDIQEFIIYNKHKLYNISISKQDITTKEEIIGAKLKLTDADGTEIDTWISTDEAHEIKNLKPGFYTITEEIAPEGYLKASSITFELKEDMTSKTNYVMYDEYTSLVIDKLDKETNDRIVGAELKVVNDKGVVFDTWTTTDEPHLIERIPVGKYTLVEVSAPSGYLIAENIEFEVIENSKPQIVTMYDESTKVLISKQDITTKDELEGAHLEIIDKDGNIVEEWISTKEPYLIEKLAVGTYTLVETIAPDGYIKAESITFEVTENSEIQTVTMYDEQTSVIIYKQDAKTENNIVGAKLELVDKNGKVVSSWTTTNKGYPITGLPVGEYTLVEKEAPKGYLIAENIKIEIKETAETQKFFMYDEKEPYTIKISKQDITTKKELPGATLELANENGKVLYKWVSTSTPYEIKGLEPGTYILTETIAPKGYVKAESIKIVLKEDMTSKTEYVMYDDYIKLFIDKKDKDSKEMLSGAVLELRKEDGTIIDTWTTNGKTHEITRLLPGKYTLTEKSAPDGYRLADDITFELRETSNIQKLTMYDEAQEYTLKVKKVDGKTGKYLSGATLKVIDEDGKTIDTWTTKDEIHVIKNLEKGKYKIIETKAPDGYYLADPVIITLDSSLENATKEIVIKNNVNKVTIYKYEKGTEKFVKGAKLYIIDEEGNKIDEWTTGKEAHTIEQLAYGKYILIEKSAPKGYKKAAKIEFEVKNTDKEITIKMYDQLKNGNTSSNLVSTGDSSNIILYGSILGISVLTLLFAIYKKKNK